MVDPTTTNKGYAIPTHGSDVDTWDAPLNSNFSILDNNLGAISSVGLTNANVTLIAAQYQCGVIRFTGTLTGNVTITLPQVGSLYTIENQCSGAFTITLQTGAVGGQVIGAPRGEAFDIFTDGTHVKYRNMGRTGKMEFWHASALPAWVTVCTVQPYLVTDGTAFNTTTYAALNAWLGSGTLPDFRGYIPAPLDPAGSRITTAGSGIDGATLDASGGAQNVTVLQANLPVVNFTNSGITLLDGTTFSLGYTYGNFAAGGTTAIAVLQENTGSIVTVHKTGSISLSAQGVAASGGSATAVNKMPPTKMAGIFVIKT